ncbi:MAG TPA: glycosyltransferase family 4 protein [Solirubrobacteraceae bacterium]|nr:glycosyltransferase family 4 protein [Solirubrobacteraceae bacterium]
MSGSGIARAIRPRLLILTPDFPPDHGGVQALVHRLALELRGFRVRVLTVARPGGDSFDRASPLDVRRTGRGLGNERARMLALNAAAVATAARFRPDLILSAHVIASPAAALIRRLLGVATLQYFHANEILGRPWLAGFAAGQADTSVAVSAYTASLVRATGVRPARLLRIPPGVDLPSEPLSLPAERPTVLTIAQLKHTYKGHDVLTDALVKVRREVRDVEWVVIGEGPLRASVEARAHAAGLAGAVRFLGAVCDAERDDWLRRASVLAMPSRLPGEGFGIVYLEANAFSKPVLAGNVAGPLDAVADGVSGLLVDPHDADAVARALTLLLTDRELAHRLGSQGAARAQGFAWPLVAARLEAALGELL